MIELNKLYNENCLDTMKRMEDNFIDLTVTSPPYDNLRNYNGYEFDFESIAKELYRVTKQGGVVVWVVGDATINGSETGTSFKQALYFKEIGFNLHDTMIYERASAPQNNDRYEQRFEYMFVLCKCKLNTFNPILESRKYPNNRKTKLTHRDKNGNFKTGFAKQTNTVISGNIKKYFNGGGQTEDKTSHKHPAIFPEKLAEDHIYSWSNENDLVYDCFMGSGTTAKMAIKLGRNFIGSEMSEEYCKIANKRIDNENIKIKMDL